MDKKSYDERVKKHLENVIVSHKTSISAASASIVGTLVGYPVNIIKIIQYIYNIQYISIF